MLLRVTLILGTTLWIVRSHEIISRQKRALSFPPTGSTMGLFLAIAVPLDLPHRNVFVSYNFEANYGLPDNYTADNIRLDTVIPAQEEPTDDDGGGDGESEGGRQTRSLDRKFTYDLLEKKLRSEGFPGRPCLLRTICEAAETPLGHNGLMGDIMHVLFTPSASRDEGLPPVFTRAEEAGRERDCSNYYSKCPVGVLDFFSEVVTI